MIFDDKNHDFHDFHNFLTLYIRLCYFSGTQVHPVGGSGSPETSFPGAQRAGGMPGIDVGMNFEKQQKTIFSTKKS